MVLTREPWLAWTLIVQLGTLVEEDISQKVGAIFKVPELVTKTSAANAKGESANNDKLIIFLFI